MDPLHFGDPVWSSEDAVAANPLQSQMMMLGGSTLGGMAGLSALARGGNAEWNPLDTLASAARYAGDITPFGIGNTLRVPEFLSSMTSPAQQGLVQGLPGLGADKYGFQWSTEQFGSTSTRAYIKEAFGLSGAQLNAAGLMPGANANSSVAASGVFFERGAKSPTGNLYTMVNGARRELTSNVAVMQFAESTPEIIGRPEGLNRAFGGVLRALNMWGEQGFSATEMFAGKDQLGGSIPLPAIAPVPSTVGSISNLGDLKRRSAMVRGVSAFELDRFNKLVSGLATEVMGDKASSVFRQITGIGLETLPGPASHTMMRIGGRVMLAGGVYAAVQETDWLRRKFGDPGNLVASTGIAGAVGAATYKATRSSKLSMFSAVGTFAGQMILPGFDKGVVPGIATTYTSMELAKATAWNPFNYYRRSLEGYLPGTTGIGATALAGIGAVLGSAFLSKSVFSRFSNSSLGMANVNALPKTKNDMYWDLLHTQNPTGGLKATDNNIFNKMKFLGSRFRADGDLRTTFNYLNNVRQQARSAYQTSRASNPVNQSLLNRLTGINNSGSNAFMKEAKGFAAQAYYSFFGADAMEEGTNTAIKAMGFGKYGPTGRMGRFGSVGLAATVAYGLLSGTFLGSMESKDSLKRQYSGQELVEVRKSRWWEGGGTPFEGSDDSYFRPHAYHLMMNRVREKGIWGANEDDISPIMKFIKKNFTYDLERQNYYDRPYPISGAAFSDVPVIGGILATTIGQFIKPPKLMHTSEWMQMGANGNIEYMDRYQGHQRDPAYGLGGHKPGVPESPFTTKQVLLDLNYQARQLSGLTGWARGILNSVTTGDADLKSGRPVLQNAGMMTDSRLMFLETQQGGAMFMNEAIRRIFPTYRKDVEKQNPLVNNMPTWLPRRFHFGDPYRSVEWGEARLPGAGYAALHPELQGVDPENYPLVHQYAILSDIAPYTQQLQMTQAALYKQRSEGLTSEATNNYIDQIDDRLAKRWNKFEYNKQDPNAIKLVGSDIVSSQFAALKQTVRKLTAPVEYLVPMGFRPVMKFMGGDRDPVEQYEFERLYGTPMAFWNKPWRDWLRPAAYSFAHAAGFTGKPLWRQDADESQQLFDQLEFIKYMKLAEQAGQTGNGLGRSKYLSRAASTRAGISPDASAMDMFWVLPDSEKKFFNEFVQSQDRARIAQMIPKDQLKLYQAAWDRIDSGQSLLSGDKVDEDYLQSQYQAVVANIEKLPSADWIGYNEQVNIKDIKVKYIQEAGAELSDYGIYESEVDRAFAASPYLEGSTDFMYDSPNRGMIDAMGYNQMHFGLTTHTGYSGNSAHLTYNDNRDSDIVSKFKEYINGY